MDKRLLDRFLAADADVDRIDEQLKEAKKKRAELETRMIAAFERDGIQRIGVAGGGTIYLRRDLYASAKEEGGGKEAVTRALRALGLDEFVSETYNTNTLSGYVRELDKSGEELPEELAACVKVAEKFSVRVTAS